MQNENNEFEIFVNYGIANYAMYISYYNNHFDEFYTFIVIFNNYYIKL